MKRILTVLMLVFGLMSLSAQDVIVLRNADEIQAKVLQVGIDDIIYKKWDNQDGPSYQIAKKDVFYIVYANGNKDVFTQPASESSVQSPVKRRGNVDSARFNVYVDAGCIFAKDEAGPIMNVTLGFRMNEDIFLGVQSGIDALFLSPSSGMAGFDMASFPLMFDFRGFFPTKSPVFHPYIEGALGANFLSRLGQPFYYEGVAYDFPTMTIFRVHGGLGFEFKRATVIAGYALFHIRKKSNLHNGYVKVGIRLGKLK